MCVLMWMLLCCQRPLDAEPCLCWPPLDGGPRTGAEAGARGCAHLLRPAPVSHLEPSIRGAVPVHMPGPGACKPTRKPRDKPLRHRVPLLSAVGLWSAAGRALPFSRRPMLSGCSGALPQRENDETNDRPPAQMECPVRLRLLAGSCCLAVLCCLCPEWAPVSVPLGGLCASASVRAPVGDEKSPHKLPPARSVLSPGPGC